MIKTEEDDQRNTYTPQKDLYYEAEVNIRCDIAVATDIRVKLRPGSARSELFRTTCFGPWLDVRSTSNDSSLVHLILQTECTPVKHQDALFFRVRGRELRFGPEEFCLITGLRFGPHDWRRRTPITSFRDRVFGPGHAKVKVSDLKHAFDHSLDKLSDVDAVRLCLLVLLEVGFMGREPKAVVDPALVQLVDDLESWNMFPWGSYLWKVVYWQLHDVLAKHFGRVASIPTTRQPSYSLHGFIWAFKIWIFEVFPYARKFAIKNVGIPRAISWDNNQSITWKHALSFVVDTTPPGFEPLPVLTPTIEECATDWWRSSHRFFYGSADDSSPMLKKARLAPPPQPSVEVPDQPINRLTSLAEPFDVGKGPSQCDMIVCVQGYKVKQSAAPILKAILNKHGDIAAECVFKPASMRSHFLEIICEVVSRIQTNDDLEKMEGIEKQLLATETANINVSWLRAHLEAIRKRKEASKKCSLLMETKTNTILVKRAAQMDLRERSVELVAAQERFEEAERCVRVLHLVEKNLSDNILESKANIDSFARQPVL